MLFFKEKKKEKKKFFYQAIYIAFSIKKSFFIRNVCSFSMKKQKQILPLKSFCEQFRKLFEKDVVNAMERTGTLIPAHSFF